MFLSTTPRFVVMLLGFGWAVVQHSLAFSQHPAEPIVKFGMEIVDTNLGVRIAELDGSRPVAKKLREGDVLVSYTVVIEGEQQTKKIVSSESVDELKAFIRDGQKVSVTVLRRTANDPNSFESLEVELDALDLMRPQVVELATESVTQSYSTTASNYQLAPAEDEATPMIVKVHYATDRRLEPNGRYSGERDSAAQPIKYGICEVSIPPNHRRGQLESPTMWDWYRPNPKKHVFLAKVTQVGETATFDSIKSILTSGVSRKSVLFFVHGYNVSFDDAARRSAQLHFDLNYPGVSMFYSWPSNATTSGYVSDAEDILWSTKHIELALEKLCDQPEVEQIHIIAHSMGNRGIAAALKSLVEKGKANKISEVVLAAADLDAAVFKRDIAPAISRGIARTTVYASDKDKALWSSVALSGNPRVGEIRSGFPTIEPTERIDLIDASNVETDFLSHSYYGDVSLIGDPVHALRQQRSPTSSILDRETI